MFCTTITRGLAKACALPEPRGHEFPLKPSFGGCGESSAVPLPPRRRPDLHTSMTSGTSGSLACRNIATVHVSIAVNKTPQLKDSVAANPLPSTSLSWGWDSFILRPFQCLCTWRGELGCIIESSILLLIWVGQLLETSVSHVSSWGWGFFGVSRNGCGFPQSVRHPFPAGLKRFSVHLPLKRIRAQKGRRTRKHLPQSFTNVQHLPSLSAMFSGYLTWCCLLILLLLWCVYRKIINDSHLRYQKFRDPF